MNNAHEPAFPMYNELGNLNAEGLTKREYFAGLAMQGFINGGWTDPDHAGEVAKRSIKHADALLQELSKSKV